MPPNIPQKRKPHNKSRHGCERCRQRRVKCDEVRPICSACQRHDDECRYTLPPRPKAFSTFAIAQRRPTKPTCKTTPLTTGTPTQELNLVLHHPHSSLATTQPSPNANLTLLEIWCTQTCYSFTPQHAPFLRTWVVQQAQTCDYLMGSVLASTSLHLASEASSASATRQLIETSLEHQNRALVGLQTNLEVLGERNCDFVLVSTIMMMLCAFVAPIMPLGDEGQKTALDAIVDAFKFLRGAQMVGVHSFQWLFGGQAMALFGGERSKRRPHGDVDRAMENLRVLRVGLGLEIEGWTRTIDHAVKVLRDLMVCDLDEVAWLLSAGEEYVELLRSSDVMAVAILMHYGVLLARRRDIWWARFAGMKLVDELANRLRDEEKCASIIDWCQSSIKAS